MIPIVAGSRTYIGPTYYDSRQPVTEAQPLFQDSKLLHTFYNLYPGHHSMRHCLTTSPPMHKFMPFLLFLVSNIFNEDFAMLISKHMPANVKLLFAELKYILTCSTRQECPVLMDPPHPQASKWSLGKKCGSWSCHPSCFILFLRIDKTEPDHTISTYVRCKESLLLTTTATNAMFSGEIVVRPYISSTQWWQICPLHLTFLVLTAFVPYRMSIRHYIWHRC